MTEQTLAEAAAAFLAAWEAYDPESTTRLPMKFQDLMYTCGKLKEALARESAPKQKEEDIPPCEKCGGPIEEAWVCLTCLCDCQPDPITGEHSRSCNMGEVLR